MESATHPPRVLRFFAQRPPLVFSDGVKVTPMRELRDISDDARREWRTFTDPTGHFVYDLEGNASLYQRRIRKNRTLAPLTPFEVAANSHPQSLCFHPSGRFAYVGCSHGAVCQYRVRDGALVPLDPPQVYADVDPTGPWFDASGRFACVLTLSVDYGYPSTDRLRVYRVDASGRLTQIRRIDATGGNAEAIRRAYVGSGGRAPEEILSTYRQSVVHSLTLEGERVRVL